MENKHEYNLNNQNNGQSNNQNNSQTNSQSNNQNNETSSEVTTKLVEWSQENEMILVEWCDIAQCYKWMNSRSHGKFSTLNALYTIPTIVLSTITGTASFAQSSLSLEQQRYTPMIIGSVNIFIGIINTIHQYLKIAELNESHRVSAISWDKYARNIRIELAKAPSERMDAGHFLKLNRQEYDRLMETSPAIPQGIVNEFMKSFSGKEGSVERIRFDELKKPDICNIIISANEYRHHWYKNASTSVKMSSSQSMDYNGGGISLSDINKTLLIKDELLKEKEKLLNEKDNELKKEKTINNFKKVGFDILSIYKQEALKMDKYVIDFQSHYGRIPLPEEIIDNFHEEISKEHINNYLEIYKTKSIIKTDSPV
jgi:hypothetical protein